LKLIIKIKIEDNEVVDKTNEDKSIPEVKEEKESLDKNTHRVSFEEKPTEKENINEKEDEEKPKKED